MKRIASRLTRRAAAVSFALLVAAAPLAAAPASASAQVLPSQHLMVAPPGLTFAGFLNHVNSTVNSYWSGQFAARGWAYSGPRRIAFTQPIFTACGPAQPFGAGPAFYCEADKTVYLDVAWLSGLYTQYGDFAVATVIAHEWGHHLQVLRAVHLAHPAHELQADCLAGVWARAAANQQMLHVGDPQEGLSVLMAFSGDAVHGTAQQRAAAFNRGYTFANMAYC